MKLAPLIAALALGACQAPWGMTNEDATIEPKTQMGRMQRAQAETDAQRRCGPSGTAVIRPRRDGTAPSDYDCEPPSK